MAWIPFIKSLPQKPEVLRIAAITGLAPRTVWSTLLEFWAWADEQTEDGILPGLDVRVLSEVCPHVDGRFWDAMQTVGWLNIKINAIEIPNFDVWMGESAKKRLKDARRQQRNRKGLPPCPKNVRADVDTKRTPSVTTEQNRTINTPLPPKGGTCAGFEKFWSAYPRKINQRAALRAWNELNPDEALAATILDALSRLKVSRGWQDQNGRYIPAPSKYLRECRWEEAGPAGESTAARIRRIQAEMTARRAERPSLSPEEIRERLKRAQRNAGTPPPGHADASGLGESTGEDADAT